MFKTKTGKSPSEYRREN
ncbi:hypothetical protein [Chitinophaga sancti]